MSKTIYRVLYDKEQTPDGNFCKVAEEGVERENEFGEVKTPNKIIEEFSFGVWTVTIINTDGSEETVFDISRIFRKI